MLFDFIIYAKSTKSKARRGTIVTPHGEIKTPALVTVGTKGSVKSLTPVDLWQIQSQMIFVNTYHMVISPGSKIVKKAGGIHKYSGINKPIITDSGGFQVFSLNKNSRAVNNDNISMFRYKSLPAGRQEHAGVDVGKQHPTLVKITDDGVEFRSHYDGTTYFFTPEFSVGAQIEIGADFVVSLDENIYYNATKKYTERSLKRTQDWAKRSLFTLKKSTTQKMYGVIQGGMFEEMHKKSVEEIASLPFWGLAIGGVSVGMSKNEIRENVLWTIDSIYGDPRPRHLLGIGHLDDIIDMVKLGIDTFDCVVPTRNARVGKLYIHGTKKNSKTICSHDYTLLDILDNTYKGDMSPVDGRCLCYTCTQFTRSYLHHLFKQHELLAYRLATIHNLTFMERFFHDIRTQIEENRL